MMDLLSLVELFLVTIPMIDTDLSAASAVYSRLSFVLRVPLKAIDFSLAETLEYLVAKENGYDLKYALGVIEELIALVPPTFISFISLSAYVP